MTIGGKTGWIVWYFSSKNNLLNEASIRGNCVWRQEHERSSVNVDGAPVRVIIRSRRVTTRTCTSARDVQIIIFSPVIAIVSVVFQAMCGSALDKKACSHHAMMSQCVKDMQWTSTQLQLSINETVSKKTWSCQQLLKYTLEETWWTSSIRCWYLFGIAR